MKIAGYIIKNRAVSLLLKVFLMLISTIVLMTMVEFLAYSHYNKFHHFSTGGSDFAILFIGDYPLDNTYIYCDADILCYSDEASDNVIPLEVIMQKSVPVSTNYVTQFYSSELSEKEIVLPKNLADQFKVKRGDTIYLDVGYSIDRIEYFVKDIADNIPSVFGDSDRHIALIGFSKQYCDNVSYKTVYFHAGALNDLVLSSTYIKSVDFHSVALKELLIFIAFLSVYLLFITILSIILIYMCEKEVRAQLLKLKSMGYKSINILLIKMLMNLIFICPIIVMPAIFIYIYNSSLFLFGAGATLMAIVLAFFAIIDSRNYKGIKRRSR